MSQWQQHEIEINGERTIIDLDEATAPVRSNADIDRDLDRVFLEQLRRMVWDVLVRLHGCPEDAAEGLAREMFVSERGEGRLARVLASR